MGPISVFMNVQANMATMGPPNKPGHFTNRKLPSIHSDSVQRSRSNASIYSYVPSPTKN